MSPSSPSVVYRWGIEAKRGLSNLTLDLCQVNSRAGVQVHGLCLRAWLWHRCAPLALHHSSICTPRPHNLSSTRLWRCRVLVLNQKWLDLTHFSRIIPSQPCGVCLLTEHTQTLSSGPWSMFRQTSVLCGELSGFPGQFALLLVVMAIGPTHLVHLESSQRGFLGKWLKKAGFLGCLLPAAQRSSPRTLFSTAYKQMLHTSPPLTPNLAPHSPDPRTHMPVGRCLWVSPRVQMWAVNSLSPSLPFLSVSKPPNV